MKKIKILFIVFLVIIFALGSGGCMLNGSNKFVSYLEEKYPDDNFTFVDFEGGTPMGSYTLKCAECRSNNLSSDIYVEYNKDSEAFSDNYIDVKYYNDTNDALNEVFEKAFGNEEFYFSNAEENFNSTTESSSLNANVSFDDYKAERGIPIYAFVSNKSNFTKEKFAEKLENSIVNEKLFCDSIDIYILNDFDPDVKTNDSLQNDIVVNGKYENHLSATMCDNSGFNDAEWEKD